VISTPRNTVFDRMVTLSRAMDEAFNRNGGDRAEPRHYRVPALDAWETEHAFVVQLDLPGISPDKIDLNFDRNTLTIRGSRPATIQAPDKGEVRIFFNERASGAFERSLRFPQYVESDRITASFADGVLTITVPKAEAARPRRIEVTSPLQAKQVAS
jgi:HSP20 family protein